MNPSVYRIGIFSALTFASVNLSDAVAAKFRIELGPPVEVPDTRPPSPVYRWLPDGHIPAFQSGRKWQMYWAGSSSYRSVGFPQMSLSPMRSVLARGAQPDDFDNGGAWLYSVLPITGSRYLGIYHAEDHEWKSGRSREGVAWKSIALCTSGDGGMTWQKRGQILTSAHRKPSEPAWGGCGDHCVVFDRLHSRWVCFFQEYYLCMAVSEDPDASPGTWRKLYRGKFSEPGLGGRATPIKPLSRFAGGNPSVHFNTSLNLWFMVWHTWSGSLVYSTSTDLIRWEAPATLLKCRPGEKVWYPTIVGSSDREAGREAVLYYAFWPDRLVNQRHFLGRVIRFVRTKEAPHTRPEKSVFPPDSRSP